MNKEFKFAMYAVGEDETDAIENAVRMLNEGATFDEIDLLLEMPPKLKGS